MMNTEIASMIAAREGKKVQVSIGNIREVIRVQHEMATEQASLNPDQPTFLEIMAKKARDKATKNLAKKSEKKVKATQHGQTEQASEPPAPPAVDPVPEQSEPGLG